jgi:cytosine/adenosine deaminase-related metal-dependent hydrolase
VLSGDLLSVARVALSMQRALDNAESRKANGSIPATTTIPVREALRWITTEGARMLGRDHQIGSLTPGKFADLVIINASDLNLVPVHDPVATVVMRTSVANIESVMIGGVWKKRNGRLLVEGLETKKELLVQSGRRLVRDIERQGRAA